jgi:16S rRNA (cytosine1402-N4)-methyltransferase
MTEPVSQATVHHVAVLPAEVLAALDPRPGQTIVDATVGAAGHARAIAARLGPTGRLIGLDRDPAMLALARPALQGLPATLIEARFSDLRQVLDGLGLTTVDGVLADLGICSDQLDDPARGFAFGREGPLDMRMSPGEGESAGELLRRLNERDLADLFWTFGEERFSRRIARRIVEELRQKRTPLNTTTQLAELVRRCVPRPKGRGAIDPATRVFQALRIAVNDELRELDALLRALPNYLKPGGVAVLISFHSLEDRRVKHTFRDRTVWQEAARKPIEAADEEVQRNPRARSAKLRWARRES